MGLFAKRGPVARVVNAAEGGKYVVSTARNTYGVWETAVFEEDSLGLPKLGSPLLVLNSRSKRRARAVHSRVTNVVASHPRQEWEKSYSIAGELPGFQMLLEEENDDD
jgi:hypothetical protein